MRTPRLRTVLVAGVLAVLLVPALALTVARIWQPGSRAGVQLVAFTPLALPLYAAAALLLVVRSLRARDRGARSRGLVAALVVLLLLAMHARWVAPQFLGEVPAAAVGAQRLRILTGNLWHGQVGGLKVLQAARQQHADVIVLEEVRPKELAVMDNGGLGEEWPYRAGETDAALSGTMVFSRYPLGDVRRLPTHQGCWRMVVATPDGPWTMLAVHPESPVDVATWRADHRAILDASSGADLIVGDLNATPDQRPLQDLAAAGFRSAAELTNAGWQPTWPANGSFRLGGLLPLPPLVQIDHVLVGPRIAALRTAVVPLEDSDHRGLVVEVAAR